MRTTEKDILMICKGYYDKEKHKTREDAFDAYYKKYYRVGEGHNYHLSHKMIYDIWLKDCVRAFLTPDKIGEFTFYVVDQEALQEKAVMGKNCFGKIPETDFYDVMYHRIVTWLQLMKVRDNFGKYLIDVSDYQEHEFII